MKALLAKGGLLALAALLSGCLTPSTSKTADELSRFVPLFPNDGSPKGWRVGQWDEVSKPGPTNANWRVHGGVLLGSERGCWLMSEREYGDFILEYEFKLGPRGNSGCALRAPMKGDPAFDGLELQMADYRYNTNATAAELTGGLYRALAPSTQAYKPEEWNNYHIEMRGSRILVILNGEKIQDTDLSSHADPVKRHNGTLATGLKDRPRRGHIGFQELSRGGDHVMIRNARIKVLD